MSHEATIVAMPSRRARARHDLLSNARELMAARLADPDLTLPHIAGALFMSARQLQRAFAQSHSGFRNELVAMRVQRAADLMAADPALSVAEAARMVGYRQAPYFAKAFRDYHGVAPGKWRQACRAERRRREAAAALTLAA